MTVCCIKKCSNTWKKGYSMHRLPPDTKRRQQWMRNIEKFDFDPGKTYYVCDVHFESDMFEKRSDGKKRLRSNAVPTIFLNTTNTNEDITSGDAVNLAPSSNDINITASDDTISATSHDSIIDDNEFNEHPASINAAVCHDIQIDDNEFNEQHTASINAAVCPDIQKDVSADVVTAQKLKRANMIINKLITSKRLLMKRLKKVTHENEKISKENRKLKEMRNIGNIYNADQIAALHNKNGRIYKWSDDTIKKALRLKLSSGHSGYQELLKQGIPLPAERTLRRKCEKFDFKVNIFEEIFPTLKKFVSQFKDDRQRDCMLALDEMSITEGNQIDPSTMAHFGLSTLPDKFGK